MKTTKKPSTKAPCKHSYTPKRFVIQYIRDMHKSLICAKCGCTK